MLVAKPSPSLIAFKPRQVVLSSKPTMENKASAQSLKPHQKSLLLLSIARFLERNFFSKTLKKFLSEAQIQKNDLLGSSLDLEEMCCKYLGMSDHSISNLDKERVQDRQVDGNPKSDEQVGIASAVETTTKKKKKRSNESSTNAIADQSEVDKSSKSNKSEEQVFHEASKSPAGDLLGGSLLDEYAKKDKEKKKKKKKLDSESHVNNVECYPSESLSGESKKKSKDAVSTESNRVSDAWIENETKDKKKKKKKNKLTSDSLVVSVDQHGSENKPHAATTLNASGISLEDKTSKSKQKKKKDDTGDIEKGKSGNTESNENKNRISKGDSAITYSKGSKKRKRLDSEVLDSPPVEENVIEDSKRRKTESSEEQCAKLNSVVGADKHVSKENNGNSDEVGFNDFQQKTAELHEQENGNIEESGKKSLKKQQNGSVQPKKPFQRVSVDEVVFTDSRLEDNSYWAKDGAESGYGAKAQEVLGQVRGRDFRHEKTKKKRGSYRGGQIDLQSHSVKFNYSDDE